MKTGEDIYFRYKRYKKENQTWELSEKAWNEGVEESEFTCVLKPCTW